MITLVQVTNKNDFIWDDKASDFDELEKQSSEHVCGLLGKEQRDDWAMSTQCLDGFAAEIDQLLR